MPLARFVQLLVNARGFAVNGGSVVHRVFPKAVVPLLLLARLIGVVKRAKKHTRHLVGRLVYVYVVLFLLAARPPHVYCLLGRRAMQRVLHKVPPLAVPLQHPQPPRQAKLQVPVLLRRLLNLMVLLVPLAWLHYGL